MVAVAKLDSDFVHLPLDRFYHGQAACLALAKLMPERAQCVVLCGEAGALEPVDDVGKLGWCGGEESMSKWIQGSYAKPSARSVRYPDTIPDTPPSRCERSAAQ